ncbi:tRNA (guanosine(46)-N7)-methyltransferase TrmB [Hymenobacter busanensis]|uniref:tRNA (guanine-N(7)-)-methyltransferase n=1 Tax=Hymenobacter busanensis TaxID=2607656 RepID=A0A7L4ZTF5_9BACT|nr:tRNA (guanosine(46)-N7)-methyltransferase TrmB [Hymenobacter busanensis]KAA9339839.1 tRNA (guanosine(46)-N7)-methyltransferase TrmB [Hymenobacter busanensis]QHJ06408.1 tRNA (guanosine(46)-N7)-methyltransferase TrmB [Hymenobacter busanensis]
MGRVKLKRFAENAERADIVEPGKDTFGALRGRWHADFFRNEHPITIEIGCGKGEYTVGLAARYPERNFLGLDIKGERMHRGSVLAEEQGLTNVGFLRVQAEKLLEHFAPGELDEIWITFPDPRPRLGDTKRRLTAPRFLELYRQVLRPGGLVHLKTDSDSLFEYSVELLQEMKVADFVVTYDLYQTPELLPHAHDIQTTYERKYRERGVPIKYLHFTLS